MISAVPFDSSVLANLCNGSDQPVPRLHYVLKVRTLQWNCQTLSCTVLSAGNMSGNDQVPKAHQMANISMVFTQNCSADMNLVFHEVWGSCSCNTAESLAMFSRTCVLQANHVQMVQKFPAGTHQGWRLVQGWQQDCQNIGKYPEVRKDFEL